MAETYKQLGNVSPSATTNTLLYQCPVDTAAIISTISVCNTNGTASTFGIAIVDGVAIDLDADDWIVSGCAIAANDAYRETTAITLQAGFSIVIVAGHTGVNFHAWGCEIA